MLGWAGERQTAPNLPECGLRQCSFPPSPEATSGTLQTAPRKLLVAVASGVKPSLFCSKRGDVTNLCPKHSPYIRVSEVPRVTCILICARFIFQFTPFRISANLFTKEGAPSTGNQDRLP